jgi:hypothetical protein
MRLWMQDLKNDMATHLIDFNLVRSAAGMVGEFLSTQVAR